jgi:predicted nucleic acid-binding protein
MFDLLYTDDTLDEYRDVLLDRAYLAENDNQIDVEEFLTLVEAFGIRVIPPTNPPPRIRDEHDRIWLQAARGGHADYLVTTDPDFLDDTDLIREMRQLGTRIAPPYIFLREVHRL